MMLKFELINKIQKAGVVAVIRGNNEENTEKTAQACIKGKISAIEVAFTSPNADLAIARLSEEYSNDQDIIIGAGTVLDSNTARLAIVAGAKFVVSPSFNKETAKLCNLYSIPYIPGSFTATEIQTALSYGVDIIKMFPSSIAGTKMIKEVHGPFPNINIMPTGGISLKNMNEWFENGAFVVGVGGGMVSPAENENYIAVTENAQKFHDKYIDFIKNKY